jgi:hypothetical protein
MVSFHRLHFLKCQLVLADFLIYLHISERCDNAGFEIDIATLSGNSAKLEMWAMPKQEQVVLDIYGEFSPTAFSKMSASFSGFFNLSAYF